MGHIKQISTQRHYGLQIHLSYIGLSFSSPSLKFYWTWIQIPKHGTHCCEVQSVLSLAFGDTLYKWIISDMTPSHLCSFHTSPQPISKYTLTAPEIVRLSGSKLCVGPLTETLRYSFPDALALTIPEWYSQKNSIAGILLSIPDKITV